MDSFIVWFDVWIFVTTGCRVGTEPCSVIEYGEIKLWVWGRKQEWGGQVNSFLGATITLHSCINNNTYWVKQTYKQQQQRQVRNISVHFATKCYTHLKSQVRNISVHFVTKCYTHLKSQAPDNTVVRIFVETEIVWWKKAKIKIKILLCWSQFLLVAWCHVTYSYHLMLDLWVAVHGTSHPLPSPASYLSQSAAERIQSLREKKERLVSLLVVWQIGDLVH